MRFGKILRSLRRERLNDNAVAWTQRELADAADLPLSLIQDAEQSRRKYFNNRELGRLSTALNLTHLERVEFFAVANEPEAPSPPGLNNSTALDDLCSIISDAQGPSYIIDPLCNLVALNGAMMSYRGFSLEQIKRIQQGLIGANVLDMHFCADASLRSVAPEHWETITRSALQQFRCTALRYRHLDRFQQIVTHLQRYPLFTRLWRETRVQVEEESSQSIRFEYQHPVYGNVAYVTTNSTTVTLHGSLYMISFIALNANTLRLFGQAAESPCSVQRVTPWPNPDLLG